MVNNSNFTYTLSFGKFQKAEGVLVRVGKRKNMK